MEIFQAIILGILEGLTEFLPISSTGHLIVAQEAMGFYDASKLFTVVIQMGAIAAVVWFYRVQLLQLVKDLLSGNRQARRFWLIWVAATVPAGVFGLLFDAKIEAYSVTLTVAIALIAGGIIMWLVENYRQIPKSPASPHLQKISLKQALQIGLYQVLALIPGVSRSGATIIGGMLSGIDRLTATAFSFYLGIPLLLLAGVYKLATGDTSAIDGGTPALIAGIIASFITAFLAIGWLLRYIARHDFKIFAYYRIIFGGLLLVLLATGVLD